MQGRMEYCSSQKDGNYLVLLKIEQVVWKKIEPGIGGPWEQTQM